MLERFKQILFVIWRCMYNAIGVFLDRYLYALPIILGSSLLGLMLYLCYVTAVSLDQTNETIRAIPVIIQVEMEKTRSVIEMEQDSTTEKIDAQHRETREELQARAEIAEENQRKMKAALEKIEQTVQQIPKRQKILGVF